ncbi:MAG: hypothetical protein HPY69_05465 [Armatimonadetes bacterium]|nr:hypothetical protein [Armatimonadota bacterium]
MFRAASRYGGGRAGAACEGTEAKLPWPPVTQRRSRCLLALVGILAAAVPAAATVRLSSRTDGCTVTTSRYRLVVDVRHGPLVQMLTAGGETELARVGGLWLRQDGHRFKGTGGPAAHYHPLRSGPYLAELHLENLVLSDGDTAWPGLAELSLYCHEDRVYLVAAFLLPTGEWVNRGLYVYRAADGHRSPAAVSPTAMGLDVVGLRARARAADAGCVVAGDPAVALRVTTTDGSPQLGLSDGAVSLSRMATELPWQPGAAQEVGIMLATASSADGAAAVLAAEAAPLPAQAFTMDMGTCQGYDAARGVYALTAVTSGTPSPPRGLRAGTRFTVHNDSRRRTVVVDQRDPWGGITGGVLRDGSGLPLPIVPQFGLNFPELHAEAGEPGWATMTYPLPLEPDELREVRAEHLYHGLSDREALYLTSLDNIGDPLLLQVTLGGLEAHTLTTGPYPGALTPGNELRLNDFRRIYSQLVSRSASAILPTFFGCWDEQGAYQGLMPGFVTMRETSPFLIEYTVEAATPDGAVAGTVRVWETAHDDMTRVFTEVSLTARRAVRLDTSREARLFFLRHHALNPMAFMRFAYTGPEGGSQAGDLTYERTVVANGAPLGDYPLACLYRASNGLENGIPCSDITGNPGFVLLDWDVRLGEQQVSPGVYVFCTGANDEIDGAYARDIAVVPVEPVKEVPAGSRIHYRAVQMVWGDNSTDHTVMEQERVRWALSPLRLRATVGTVLSADPPEVRTEAGRAEMVLEGGANWVPLRIGGMRPDRSLHARQVDAAGRRLLGPGHPDEPWYSAWPDGDGLCGFTLLVRLPDAGGPVRLQVWQ